MNAPTPVVESEDIRQLRLLGLFHYILAGLLALFSLCPMLYMVIGLAILLGLADPNGRNGDAGYLYQPTQSHAVMTRQATILPAQFQVDVPGAARPGQTGQSPSSSNQIDGPGEPTPSHQNQPLDGEAWDTSPHSRPAWAEMPTHQSPHATGDTVGGVIFIVFGLVGAAFAWVLAVLLAVTGRKLSQQRGHTFCFVIAILECLWMPLGTILGVFTLVVLTRPGVKALFEANRTGQPAEDFPQIH